MKKVEFDPQEGTYYERVFSPTKVEVFRAVSIHLSPFSSRFLCPLRQWTILRT